MWPEPAGHVLSDGRKLFSNWFYLFLPARGTRSLWGCSGHHFPKLQVNRAAPEQGKPWGRRGADGVLQVNDRAREKIQVSAHLIWFPAVDYSPSAFLKMFFLWSFGSFCLEDKHSPRCEGKQCHCSRADLCQLKIWPLPFSPNPSLFLPPAALVSSKLVKAICHQCEPDTSPSLSSRAPPSREESDSSSKALLQQWD